MQFEHDLCSDVTMCNDQPWSRSQDHTLITPSIVPRLDHDPGSIISSRLLDHNSESIVSPRLLDHDPDPTTHQLLEHDPGFDNMKHVLQNRYAQKDHDTHHAFYEVRNTTESFDSNATTLPMNPRYDHNYEPTVWLPREFSSIDPFIRPCLLPRRLVSHSTYLLSLSPKRLSHTRFAQFSQGDPKNRTAYPSPVRELRKKGHLYGEAGYGQLFSIFLSI